MYYVIIIIDHFHDVARNNDLIYMKKKTLLSQKTTSSQLKIDNILFTTILNTLMFNNRKN